MRGRTRDDLSGSSWLSVHLHFGGNIYGEEADRRVLEWAAPLASACVEAGEAKDWFFIRYAADGSHLRLRLLTSLENAEACRRRVHAAFQTNGASLQDVRWIDYEPEIQRYGGEHAIPVAEDLFCASSAIAVDLLRKIQTDQIQTDQIQTRDRASRLGKACLAMLVQLHVFLRDAEAAARLSQTYGTHYLSQMMQDEAVAARFLKAFESGRQRQGDELAGFVEAVWQALSQGDALTPEMDRYRACLESTRQRLLALLAEGELMSPWAVRGDAAPLRDSIDVLSTIFPSYLHMMNNRLGVTVQEECYLAVVIAATLESMGFASPGVSPPVPSSSASTTRTSSSA